MATPLAQELRAIDPQRRAECAHDLIIAARCQSAKVAKPKPMSARDALIALEFEALLVSVAAWNIANGVTLTEEDRKRLTLAYSRIDRITSEIA